MKYRFTYRPNLFGRPLVPGSDEATRSFEFDVAKLLTLRDAMHLDRRFSEMITERDKSFHPLLACVETEIAGVMRAIRFALPTSFEVVEPNALSPNSLETSYWPESVEGYYVRRWHGR